MKGDRSFTPAFLLTSSWCCRCYGASVDVPDETRREMKLLVWTKT